MLVSGGITTDGMSTSKVDPSGVYSLTVKANSVLCVQCGERTHGRCAGVNMVTTHFSRTLACRKCDGNIGEAVEQEEVM